MRKPQVVKTSTVRWNSDDLEVIARLQKLTGLGINQLIRASLRSVLRKVEAESRKGWT